MGKQAREGCLLVFTAYVVLTLLTALAVLAGAVLNLARHPIPVAASRQIAVPVSFVRPIGAVFLAAAIGLLVGLAVRGVGVLAAGGLVVHFVLAVLAHLRVRDWHIGQPLAALALAAATLVVSIAA